MQEVIKTAEEQLKSVSQQPGYGITVLKVCLGAWAALGRQQCCGTATAARCVPPSRTWRHAAARYAALRHRALRYQRQGNASHTSIEPPGSNPPGCRSW